MIFDGQGDGTLGLGRLGQLKLCPVEAQAGVGDDVTKISHSIGRQHHKI
jgi:hypothetical protein